MKQIRDWLRQPACRLFRQHLSALAAAATAQAGNNLIGDENGPLENEAKQYAENARMWLNAEKAIDHCAAPGYEFESSDLKPKQANLIPDDTNKPKPVTFPGSPFKPEPTDTL